MKGLSNIFLVLFPIVLLIDCFVLAWQMLHKSGIRKYIWLDPITGLTNCHINLSIPNTVIQTLLIIQYISIEYHNIVSYNPGDVICRPGQSQGLLHKYLCNLFIN